MKTIKLPIQNTIDINDLQRSYSSAVRFAYNRFIENKSEKEIRFSMKDKFLIGSWLVQCSIKQAQSIIESQKELKIPKIIFGSKKLFKSRCQKKITKEQLKESRLLNIQVQGEQHQKGNRLFKIDIIENNKILFKPNKNTKINIQLPKLRKNIKRELSFLEQLANEKQLPFQVSLNKTHIFITFDETKIYKDDLKQVNDKRVLGIDLNPNYIGYSILEFNKDDSFKVIFKEIIDLTKLNKCKSSKKDFEFYQITKRIIKIAERFQCSKLIVEELSIKAKDHSKGTNFNKLVNNDWNRNIIVNSLKKHCNIFNIKYVEVNPAYSSTIGNLLYGNESTPDMVASSIEVGRRGYKKFMKGWFYPSFELPKQTTNQWKKELFVRFKTWIEIHQEIKNSKMKYRVQLSDCICDAVCRFSSIKSNISLYSFI